MCSNHAFSHTKYKCNTFTRIYFILFSLLFIFSRLNLKQITKNKVCLKSRTLNRCSSESSDICWIWFLKCLMIAIKYIWIIISALLYLSQIIDDIGGHYSLICLNTALTKWENVSYVLLLKVHILNLYFYTHKILKITMYTSLLWIFKTEVN